jgi:hypothetical protein
MALKDLIADSAALTEKAIEDIVRPYVQYDPKAKRIGFTPKAKSLPKKHKLILHLIALQGWSYVSDESIPTTAKPAELEDAIGIPGGTLRPMLKDLKENHYVTLKSGRYGVQSSSLDDLKALLAGETPSARGLSSRVARRGAAKDGAKKDVDHGVKGKRRSAKKGVDLTAMFRGWIKDGWFKQKKRSMKDLKQKFREKGVMVQNSTLPAYLLMALRENLLEREMATVDGRQVWVYWQPK